MGLAEEHGPTASGSAPRSGAETFSIRELCRAFGVTARTLRFYEEKGLLSPGRLGLERIYSRKDRARLQYILMGKGIGFSLDEIREMLDLYGLGGRQAPQLESTLHKVRSRIERLERQRSDIDRAVAELSHASKVIQSMLAARERNARSPDRN